MASRFEIGADRQAAANERQERDTAKALHEAATYKTENERADARRGALYIQHKRAGTLTIYYYQYPMDPGARHFYADQERER